MSSLPGTDLEAFLAWAYDLVVEDAVDANVSMGIAEMLGTAIKHRPVVSQEKFKELVTIYECDREVVERLLDDFDEDNQSWRDYASCFDDYLTQSSQDAAEKWMQNNGYWKVKT